jgi:hypothetical protein
MVHNAGNCIYNKATKTWAGAVVFTPGRNGNTASSTAVPYYSWYSDTNVSAMVLFSNYIEGDSTYGAHVYAGRSIQPVCVICIMYYKVVDKEQRVQG